MGDEDESGGSLMAMTKQLLAMGTKIQKASAECLICKNTIPPGAPYIKLADTELGVVSVCQDCTFIATVAYVKAYKVSLAGDEKQEGKQG